MAGSEDNPGAPISYLVLEKGVEVVANDGAKVGTVDKVLAVERQDIFDGVLIQTGLSGTRFIKAELIEALYEQRVDLKLSSTEVEQQPAHDQGSASFDADPTGGEWKPEQ